jgi:methionyl-tRNA formyltransferase
MRIAFLGTPDLTLPLLESCARAGELVVVIAQPDRAVGRHKALQAPPSKRWALEHNIPVLQPEKVKQGRLAALLAEHRPDVAVVAAYGRILPLDALRAPRLGCVNVHASLLPLLRGAAPAQWAIARGYGETGVTLMQMDEGLDTGDILLQRSLAIAPGETAESLLPRLGALGAEMLSELLPALARLADTPAEIRMVSPDSLARVPQDHARATLAPILSREDGKVDFTRTAFELDARRRGFTPWPGAWTTVNIHQARPVELTAAPAGSADSPAPGTLLADATVACAADTAWQLIEVQPEGKKRMPASAWLQGARLKAGDRLGS